MVDVILLFRFIIPNGKTVFAQIMDLRGSILTFIWLTESKVNDMNGLDVIPVEPGVYYLLDKATPAYSVVLWNN